MVSISSFVFFDIETTGLPRQERNRTKITDLAFIAVSRKDILTCSNVPPVSKLVFNFNPQKEIHPEATKLTGLSNEVLKNSPIFSEKTKSIISFLDELPKPVCLVAHNGNCFDYKILRAECLNARISLPSDVLCVDSLVGFRKLLKDSAKVQYVENFSTTVTDTLLTDDENENEWPELNISNEDWEDIDNIRTSLSNICGDENVQRVLKGSLKSGKDGKDIVRVIYNGHVVIYVDMKTFATEYEYDEMIDQEYKRILNERERAMRTNNSWTDSESDSEIERQITEFNLVFKRSNVGRKAKNKSTLQAKKPNRKGELTLSGLYKRLLNKEATDAHRAESDCFMLLECVKAAKNDFLPWADQYCKKLTEIKPFVAY